MKRKLKRSYDLLSNYKYYVPNVKGMVVLLVLFALGGLLGNLITGLFVMAFPAEAALSYSMLISYPVMFLPPMLYASRKSRMNELFEKPFPLDVNNFAPFKAWQAAVFAVVSTIALAIAIEPLSMMLPEMPDYMKRIFEDLMGGNMPLWAALLTTAVFAPFFEEWLCRGMVMRGLLKRTRPVWAIVISALFFAVIHLNPWQALSAFALGLLFGYVYYRTGSLKLTMLMHCANNAFAVLATHFTDASVDATLRDMIGNDMAYVAIITSAAVIVVVAILLFRKIQAPKRDFTENETYI